MTARPLTSLTVEGPAAGKQQPAGGDVAADSPRLPQPVLVREGSGGYLPLFYLGGAVAAPDAFAAIARELRPGPAVYVCCFPGNGGPADGNWAYRPLACLAGEIVGEIRRVQPIGPYLLCGYSLGARIVFEAARQIQIAGERVGLLALLDGWAPGYPVRYSRPRRALIHLGHLLRGPGTLKYLKGRVTNVRHRLKHRAARNPARRNGNDDHAAPTSQPLSGLGLINALHHRPNVYEGDVVLIRADVTPDWPGSCFDDTTNGWKAFVRGSIDVRHVRCRHLELLSPPAAAKVADVLDNCIAKAL
jgi:thioesterase domain-containing protein